MTQAAKLARAESRMTRCRAAFNVAMPGTVEYAALVTRYQRAARVWQLRRNQAGGA